MKLSDCLARMPAADRLILAQEARVADGADLSALARALARPERVSRSLSALGPAGRDALTLAILAFDGQADRNTLARELGRMHPTAAGEALAALEQAALVAPRTASPWSFVLLEEAAPAARGAVAAWLQEACAPWAEDVRPVPPADPVAALADTVRLLAALADGVRVRQEGGIFQLDQRRLAQLLDRSRPALPEPVFRGWADYPSEMLACHLALAMQLDLLEGDGRGWRASEDADAWVDAPAAVQWGELVQAWLDLAALRLGGRLAVLLAPFADGRWVDFNRWRGHLARYVRMYPPLPAVLDALFLRPGLMLGAIATGVRSGAGDACRLTEPALAVLRNVVPDLPPPAERVLVGADFEVVVPPGAPARVIWDLARWARPLGADRVSRYRITRETVRALSRAGEPAAAWLSRLAAESRFGVPDNVRLAVLEWALPARRASMRPVVVLRFPEGVPEGWSPPAGAQPAGPDAWLLDLPAAVKVAASLRRAGVVVDGTPEEWTAMEHARQEQRLRTAPAPMSMPWPGPLVGDPRTLPWMDAHAGGG